MTSASRCGGFPGKTSKSPGETGATGDDDGRGCALQGDAPGGRRGDRTATSPRRQWRFSPTFLGVMRWRTKDAPDYAMRCRSAPPAGCQVAKKVLTVVVTPWPVVVTTS